MVAGYLGMLPLLQSLAAEPAWPTAPAAVGGVAAAPQVVTFAVPPAAQTTHALASSRPAKIKSKKNNAKAAKHVTQGVGSPASSTGSNSHANQTPSSGGAVSLGGGSSSGLASGGGNGGGGSCVGTSGC
jgi:hypothetical protein